MSQLTEIIPLLIGLTAIATAILAYKTDKKRAITASCDVCLSFEQLPVSSNDYIKSSEISAGIRELTKYCFHIKPDFIIGLNRGGVMVGAYVALSIGLPSDKFLRCCVAINDNDVSVDCDFKELYGKVVVIDSITRSGRTLNSAVDYLLKKYHGINKLNTAAIISTIESSGKSVYSPLDFYVYHTSNSDMDLPWVQPYRKVKGEKRAQKIKKDYMLVNDKNISELAVELYADFDK